MEAVIDGPPLPIKRHAHWDCSQGINCSTLLEACLDAWTNIIPNEEITGMDVIKYILRDLSPTTADAAVIQLERQPTLVFKIQWQSEENPPDLSSTNARNCLQESNLLAHTKSRALRVVQALEDARSKFNSSEDTPLEDETYFSLQVVCVLWLWHQLQVQSISFNPLSCQSASLETLLLLRGMPTNPNQTSRAITPAAVAILQTLIADSRLVPCPPITLQAVGASEGDAEFSVRLLLGVPLTESPQSTSDTNSMVYAWKTDRLIHMEANLDDITAEALAFAVEVLLENGAADAWIAPIVMKKGRAAHTLHCLCRQVEDDSLWRKLLQLMFQHTTTLGIRIQKDLERAALHRRFVTVLTPYSSETSVDVKIGYFQGGDVLSVKAEFDHCKKISLETGISIQEIAAFAVREALADNER